MINEQRAHHFCKDDITKIENYYKAIEDTTQMWHCHHRDEVRTLPSGITVIRSREELIENGRYYNCPANELIFLTKSEHSKLHSHNRTDEYKRKMSEIKKGKTGPMKGKHHSFDARKKMSEAQKGKNTWCKGRTASMDTRKKLSDAHKGRTFTEEHRKKMAESAKKRWAKKKEVA